MADNYVYMLDGKAYVNLTNKCCNACVFCIRNTGDGVKDTSLWLDREPMDADEVWEQFEKLRYGSGEVVFCGFGEPTERLELLKACAAKFKSAGYKTRLNTNGLGGLVNGRDIASELAGVIDVASVSLNASDAIKYAQVTRSAYGEAAFDAVAAFALDCKAHGIETVFTVVDTIGDDEIAACKRFCEKLGIPLRIREYIADNYNNQ